MSDSLSDLAGQLDIHQATHLPIIAAFCREIGIDRIVNRLVPTSMDLDAGTVVVGMILDTLSGRSPLYRLHKFFRNLDTELLFGYHIASASFNDDAVGRVLDRLHQAGTMKIFTEISLNACRHFDIQTGRGNFDTTSVNVWGDYAGSTAEGQAPHITHGHSKDKRPDLKQFMFSLLCVEGNIPLAGKVQDGNAADTRLNNEELQHISELIKTTRTKPEDFLYIADCKLVNQPNLQLLGNNPFVTRLPASYNVHREVIDRALAQEEWEPVGALNQTPQSNRRPAARYKISSQSVQLYDMPYRAIVVHSDNHDKRRLKRIKRELETAKKKALEVCGRAARQSYQCQGDAQAALESLKQSHRSELWQIEGQIQEVKRYAPGRPPAKRPRPVKSIHYQLQLSATENIQLVARHKERAGCFVLLTNTEENSAQTTRGYTGRECLEAYKEQHGVERNFSFLKEPLIVNDVFLKKPERIDGLGLVLLLSLLVWSLMERTMRKNQREQNLDLRDLDYKPTRRPTSFILIHHFTSVLIIGKNNQRCLARKLSPIQGRYLLALGLSYKIFINPPPHAR